MYMEMADLTTRCEQSRLKYNHDVLCIDTKTWWAYEISLMVFAQLHRDVCPTLLFVYAVEP
jgi:hypothetical protein